jgi:serine/threonine protein kinase
MPVSSGGRLGPYELLSSLGAGGMGEVYRARDTRLGRDVAVKVVAADGASNPDRLHRFEQEARAVAALDHPHILSIHDVGTENGTAYVVFELLEGETLRQRLERGPLPTRKAVELVVQTCRGLAAAHARGIIHRDLKPENLFLTKDGRLKILDFGLAKLKDTPEREDELKKTRTHTATEQGMLLGTVGYMSPEQARGQPADARSDLFALGAIVYEMLSGRRAFEGATPADLLSAILTREPPEIVAPNGAVPAALERVVRRCLEKDPEERFQSARDIAFALEALSSAPQSGTEVVPAPSRPRRGWFIGLPIVTLLGVATLVRLPSVRALWERPLPTIKQLTYRRGDVHYARFTSDGRTVVYSGLWDGNPWDLFSTRAEGPESRSLGLPPAQLMGVSARGELAILLIPPGGLGWAYRPGTLARVSLSGGAPREVIGDVLLADWSPDGRELAVVRQVDGQFQLEYPIGNVLARPVATWAGMGMRISPRGDRVAVSSWSEIALYDRAGKKTSLRTPVVDAGGLVGFAWGPDDTIWFTGGEGIGAHSLWQTTLDGKSKEIYRAPGGLLLQDVSPDGRALVTHGVQRLGVRAKPRGETSERELGVFTWSLPQGLSDDGTELLVNEGTGGAAYLQSTHGGTPVRLGDGEPVDLSPDGKWALILSRPRLTLTPTGPGEPRPLLTNRFAEINGASFLDSKHVLVHASETGRPQRTFLFDLSGGEPRPVTPEGVVAIPGSYAGDSLLGSPELGGGTLTRFRLDGGEPQPMPAHLPDHASPIRVTADGKALFISQGDIPLRVDRFDLATGRVTPRTVLRPDDLTGVVWINPPVMTPDGEAYAYGYSRFLLDLYLLEGLR